MKTLQDTAIENQEQLISHLLDAIDADFIEIDLPDDDEEVEPETTWKEAGFSIVDVEVISVPLNTEHIYNEEIYSNEQ